MKVCSICIFLLSIVGCNSNKLIVKNENPVEMSIYKNFSQEGTTTIGGAYKMTELKNNNVEKIVVDSADIDMFCQIISNSKCMRLRQSKTGIYLLYMDAIFANGENHNLVLCYDSAIIDYTQQVVYIVSDNEYRKYLQKFQNKYRKEILDWD